MLDARPGGECRVGGIRRGRRNESDEGEREVEGEVSVMRHEEVRMQRLVVSQFHTMFMLHIGESWSISGMSTVVHPAMPAVHSAVVHGDQVRSRLDCYGPPSFAVLRR